MLLLDFIILYLKMVEYFLYNKSNICNFKINGGN